MLRQLEPNRRLKGGNKSGKLQKCECSIFHCTEMNVVLINP